MIIGEVVGNLWATRKDENLSGFKFLVVRKLDSKGEKTDNTIVAVDSVGAGIGDQVLIVSGSSARYVIGDKKAPIDATIVGIIDSLELV
ncbi:ethanolamine utilization EutN/carboxysome family protein [Clostridium argentinense CDC 2741]|uniref:Ethanolamine utilization EutN/carboxysome family protein n=1 Tax=Clostridium argentinense CDC 2741 TaxID=1418104 RepID=A0A0C1U5M9_9CLOT|nr:EutN/CcmL family microcompartment protein [Clostridium argentinense]HAG42480.1 ethanolamine utilization protein EutN [Clostridium sp.]ARC85451.1 ethanolamine utilization protein EutN [Clostridium argentinense]KIE47033.1 ethanolamine utilization EutN/carboxysome family protein [Clostridium argentinense CDC 2741]NFF39963.1 ethanolamine utilization protein EutN [Clostridium argentinense]NFP50340.1 ethanolamine utilization protein EutN [Clostridium argentinense]